MCGGGEGGRGGHRERETQRGTQPAVLLQYVDVLSFNSFNVQNNKNDKNEPQEC